MFNRALSLMALIGLLFIATACNMPALSGTKDCGEDMQCFIEAAENCDPAKVNFTAEIEMMGIRISSTAYQEIVDKEDELCVYKILTGDVQVELTDEAIDQMLDMGLTQEQIDEQVALIEESANQEQISQICRVEPARLATVMSQWADGEYSTEDWTDMDCEDVVEE